MLLQTDAGSRRKPREPSISRWEVLGTGKGREAGRWAGLNYRWAARVAGLSEQREKAGPEECVPFS